ncbi:hypothetical protein L596_019428 [Steinernema carpocapsae]|uniref:Uncharacterized protein n=1 Tax=Steinernema carpocapsae TaxID=34508 RepID=A0A4U5MQH2_STECR|nr:hypothetical protein L596_019428 [Steinernema carpocapsae]
MSDSVTEQNPMFARNRTLRVVKSNKDQSLPTQNRILARVEKKNIRIEWVVNRAVQTQNYYSLAYPSSRTLAFKKSNFSRFSTDIDLRRLVRARAAVENKRSLSTDVAGAD